MTFTNLREATREDWDRIDALDEARTDYAEAPLALLESLRGGDAAGYTLNPYDHSLQAATRALRAGESTEMVVCILFHDAADRLAPANHGQIAAELLRPFVSDDHLLDGADARPVPEGELHQSRLLGQRRPRRDARAAQDHPAFELTRRFCRDYDAPSFDPAYDSLPLDASCPRSARSSSGRTRSRPETGAGAPHRGASDGQAQPADVLDAVLLAPEDEEDRIRPARGPSAGTRT